MRELFVYYRIRKADAVAAREAVSGMQSELRLSQTGLRARLFTRQSVDGGLQTWMETYSLAGGKQGIDADLEAAIEAAAAAWSHLVDGTRHVEAFEAEARSS